MDSALARGCPGRLLAASGSAAGIRSVDELASYERRFRRAGLPLLIEGYSASTDVFTRAAPLLALVFLGEMFGALNLDWSPLANVGAVLGGLAILVGAFGAVNLARGRRFFAVPQDVGWVELAAFVLVPAVLPVIFGGQVRSAIVTAGANALLLLLVYGVVGYGLLYILRWASVRLFSQLAASLALLVKAVPLLLVFALVLFLTTEMWQVSASLPRAFLPLVGSLFIVIGAVFLIARVPREVQIIENDAGSGPPLSRRQLLNVGLVMFVSQALQVLVVSLAVAAFFVAFGLLAIQPEIQTNWSDAPRHVVLSFDLLGGHAAITESLVRVSGFIAVFSGLYYAIAMLTDDTYRKEFLEELSEELRDTFKARAQYLRLRKSTS